MAEEGKVIDATEEFKAVGAPKTVDVAGIEMPEGLTEEQREDLAEAVEAEQIAIEAPKNYDELQRLTYELHAKMIEFMGREPQGPLAYCRHMAQTKLEEFSHRLGDALAIYRIKDKAEMEAFRKAQAEGKVVNLTGGKK